MIYFSIVIKTLPLWWEKFPPQHTHILLPQSPEMMHFIEMGNYTVVRTKAANLAADPQIGRLSREISCVWRSLNVEKLG